jgi:hypothetical protein
MLPSLVLRRWREVEAGGLWIWGQPGPLGKTLSQLPPTPQKRVSNGVCNFMYFIEQPHLKECSWTVTISAYLLAIFKSCLTGTSFLKRDIYLHRKSQLVFTPLWYLLVFKKKKTFLLYCTYKSTDTNRLTSPHRFNDFQYISHLFTSLSPLFYCYVVNKQMACVFSMK